MTRTVRPGAVIGVLGSGQLGRMLGLAARRMGYRLHTFSPEHDTPTGQVAEREVTAPYEDRDALRAFARSVSVVTFEFENVPAAAAEALAECAPVRPSPSVLHTTQHRLREKTFLTAAGLPVTPFVAVHALEDLETGLARVGCPAVLKTADLGYDGKGQVGIGTPADARAAWEALDRRPAILESYVDFAREVSVVLARGLDGSMAHYGAIENTHCRHILDVSQAPARVAPRVAKEAVALAEAVARALDFVGVLCVEFFITRDDRVLINEVAPRPHNSGHLTIEACVTSQFEQQLRAVCGLPLGSTRQLSPAAMANLLGDLWATGEPDWEAVSAYSEVKLHLYGKRQPRPGRKMGHLTALAPTADEATSTVLAARRALAARGPSPPDPAT